MTLQKTIQNKSFVPYAFISKNRHEQNSKGILLFLYLFSLLFRNNAIPFVFNIPYFSIAQYLEHVCIQLSPLQQYINQKHIDNPSESESTILTLNYSKM